MGKEVFPAFFKDTPFPQIQQSSLSVKGSALQSTWRKGFCADLSVHDKIKTWDFPASRKQDNEIIFNLCPSQALSTPVTLGICTGTTGCEFVLRLVIIPANYSFGGGRGRSLLLLQVQSRPLLFSLTLHKQIRLFSSFPFLLLNEPGFCVACGMAGCTDLGHGHSSISNALCVMLPLEGTQQHHKKNDAWSISDHSRVGEFHSKKQIIPPPQQENMLGWK